jgi:hypothetical protein
LDGAIAWRRALTIPLSINFGDEFADLPDAAPREWSGQQFHAVAQYW